MFHALGIDVGGTKIAAGWVTFPEGTIHSRQVTPTDPARGGAAVLADVVRLAEGLIADARAAGTTVDAIGLGLCELVDTAGVILSAHCVRWMDQPVRARLSALAPLTLEADVRAAARAEAVFGAGRGFRQFLYLTVGTGIASSLVMDGDPFVGTRGATGTMASATSIHACDHCGRISRRSLEQIASGPALVERYNQRRPGGARTAEDVLAAAAAGDGDARAIVRTGGEALGSAVGLLIDVLDPEAVIVGGGLGLSEGPFWDSFIASTRRHVWSDVHRDLPILRAATGQDAGLLGAATSAWKKAGSAP